MDCSVLARCVFRNNGWDTIALEFCDAGQGLYCNANEQKCSASPGPCNPGAGQGKNSKNSILTISHEISLSGGGNFACTGSGLIKKNIDGKAVF